MKKFLTDFESSEKGQDAFHITDARWMVYSHRVRSLGLKVLVFMVVRDHRRYVITCSSVPENFSKYRGQFEEIARSFWLE